MQETHLFILWQNALNKKDEILKDIKENFTILNIYKITWDKQKFANNLSRFYGTKLPKGSGKEEHCGNGSFLLVVVKCENPKYELRNTSHGDEIVNINMFDKKMQYREMTGGGHRVHGTDSQKETDHDLTLLTGMNIEDFLKNHSEEWNGQIEELNQDLIGTYSWKNAEEMFYALNNCTEYAILRNYEALPEEIYVNEHNDIDVICNSFENVTYILNAEKVFEEEYRVHYKTQIGEKIAYFDLRYIGDNYYCKELEESLLKNRIYNDKGFYTISNEEYFYTLLYHAILHKPEFAQDYKDRLSKMREENLNTEDDYIKILKDWLIKQEYQIIRPVDKSVQFNEENAEKFGRLLYNKKQEAIKSLEKENQSLKTELDRIREELTNVYNSKSWKSTEILRKISHKIKNGE